ncbi:MAG: hypothetical protein WBL63_00680 [Candidatus Acidiferrum sp.]
MPATLSPTLQAKRRAWHSWFDDGIPSIVASAGCLLMAFFLFYPGTTPGSTLSIAMFLMTLFLYGAVMLRHRQIVDWLKTRITYPRVGYVDPPNSAEDAGMSPEVTVLSMQAANAAQQEQAQRTYEGRKKQFWLALALALIAICAGMFIHSPWACFVVSLLMATGLCFIARNERRASWVLLVGLPIAGFGLSIALPRGIAGPTRFAYLLACGGLLLFLDGAVSLIRFLLRNPRPSSTAP